MEDEKTEDRQLRLRGSTRNGNERWFFFWKRCFCSGGSKVEDKNKRGRRWNLDLSARKEGMSSVC